MDVKTAVLLCCAAAAAFPAVARETLTLVRDGAAEATIVIGAKPTKAARFAAAEFRHVVKLMTGAELPVAAEKPSAGVAVWIGCGTDETFAGEEYSVRFRDGGIVLAGHDAEDYGPFDYADVKTLPALTYCFRSTTYAVYDFLEKWCGVRFYGYGDSGIAFTARDTLSVAAKGGYRRAPKMDAYRWPYFGGSKDVRLRHSDRDERILLLRWRMNAMFGEVNHSVMGLFVRYWKPSKHPARGKYFIEERHDYFAKGYDGANAPSSLRKWDYPGDPDLPPQVCTSAEGPVDYFADEAVRMHAGEKIECTWATRPVMKGMPFYYPVQEDDCCWWCKCDRCRGNPLLGEYNSRHFDWINRIARKAREKDPTVGIGTLAYSDSLLPPDIPLERNVLVQVCLSLQSWFHPYTYARQHGAYRDWVKKTAGRNPLTLWLYMINPWSEAVNIHKYGKFFPVVYPRFVGRCFREFNADGVRGFFAEITPRYHLLEGYVAAKLADDPLLDPDEMIDEHYRLYYGAAGDAMKKFSDTFEKESFDPANYSANVMAIRPTTSYIYKFHTERDNWHLGSAERIARLDALVNAAKAAAKTPLERARIDDYCSRIWNTAVEGRREYELRERQRAVARPFAVASWGEKTRKRLSSDFATLDNGPAATSARFGVSADESNLYFSFEEKGDDARRHGKLGRWMNGVELFLADDQETKNGYLQIAVGADGSAEAILWRIDEGGWRSVRQPSPAVASSASKDGWTFSFALPFSAVPGARAGGDLFANVFRTRRWEGGVSTAWSPIFCENYRAALHRNGRIFTSAPTERGAYPLDFSKWRTPAEPADGESLKRTADGIAVTAGKSKPLVVMQDGTFPACHAGDRVVLEFDARGKAPWAAACLYLLTGRHYGAGTVQGRFKPTAEWSRHRIVLTVGEPDPKHPPTVYRPGFLLAKDGELEIRSLTVSAE